MFPHSKLTIIAIVCAALFLIAPLARGDSPAQASSTPSQVEREFWDATRQIGSIAAYQAYLSRFPNGFYAPLASAAISKASNAASSSAPATSLPTEGHNNTPSDAVSTQFSASRIAGPTRSSAIAQQAGDIFRGPGPMTVGWIGGRKQLVVPRGEWVLLAAEDSLDASAPYTATGSGGTSFAPPMPVTTLILARLEGRIVRSFLLARFNSKEGNPRHLWPDALACGSSSDATFTWRERGYSVTQCVEASLHRHTQANFAKTFSGAIWEEAIQKVAEGGGALPSSSYLVTNMHYTGDSSHYLKISRIDFGVSPEKSGSDTSSSLLVLSLQGREEWARAYSALAALGYRMKLSENELQPGSSPTISAATLPD